MSEDLVLKGCSFVVTPLPGGGVRVYEGVDVVIEGGVITWVGREAKDVPRGAERLRMTGYIVIPGVVNAHTHAAMVALRGFADNEELREWLRRVWVAEKRLSRDLVRKASLVACYEMLLSGTTCFQDMYFFFEETVKAAKEVGLRVRAGPLCGWGGLTCSPGAGVTYDLFTPIVNVHSLYSLELSDVAKCFEEARRLGLDVQIHVSETRWEVFSIRSRTGKFPVELLNDLGLLTPSTYLVHLNWVTNWEINYIARGGSKVAVCPSSSMKLANSGFTPIYELDRLGVKVTIGTDGACSSNRLFTLGEVRELILLYRHNYWDTRVRAENALRYATLNAYSAMNIKSGAVAEGMEADLVVLSTKSPWMRPLKNPLSLITYSASRSDVAYVIVRGKVLLSPEVREEVISKALTAWEDLEKEIDRLWR